MGSVDILVNATKLCLQVKEDMLLSIEVLVKSRVGIGSIFLTSTIRVIIFQKTRESLDLQKPRAKACDGLDGCDVEKMKHGKTVSV